MCLLGLCWGNGQCLWSLGQCSSWASWSFCMGWLCLRLQRSCGRYNLMASLPIMSSRHGCWAMLSLLKKYHNAGGDCEAGPQGYCGNLILVYTYFFHPSHRPVSSVLGIVVTPMSWMSCLSTDPAWIQTITLFSWVTMLPAV